MNQPCKEEINPAVNYRVNTIIDMSLNQYHLQQAWDKSAFAVNATLWVVNRDGVLRVLREIFGDTE